MGCAVNRFALAWLDVALALEAENEALREIVVELAIALDRARELGAFAREQVEERHAA